jgi:integrase
MTGDDYQRARNLRSFRGRAKPRGRALGQDEIRDLMQVCRSQSGPKGTRDAALFALAYGTGARRAELVAIRYPRDLDLERSTLELHTKGQKHRQATLQPQVRQALEAWIAKRGTSPGALFQPVDRFGYIKRRALTPGAIFQLCEVRAREAGIRPFSPHDFRRTFAAELLDAGVDLHVVAQMLDHEQLTTTARYDPRASSRATSAAGRLRIPF